MDQRVRNLGIVFLMAFSGNVFAINNPVINFEERPSETIELSSQYTIENANQAIGVLRSELSSLFSNQSDLVLVHKIESPMGHHYTFDQVYQGAPVWQASIRLHTDRKGHPFLIQSTLAAINDAGVPERTPGSNRLVSLGEAYVWGRYQVVRDAFNVPFEQLVIDNRVVWENEGRLHLTQKDTTVFGYVYLPNPINSAMVSYGDPYVDSMDANTQVLRDERKLVQFNARLVNDTFYLENDWLVFKDFSNPVTSTTFSLTDSFLFDRSQPGFEDVNAYYHINNMADYVTALGYGNLIFDKILIDAHGQFGQDNSSFNYMSNPVQLEFGTGGVDDAEDAEVIIHEFAHSLSHHAAPFTFEGTERRAMEEGNSDYFSVSYKRQYNDHHWGDVFSWDGHNEYWSGFSASSMKNYKTDLKGIMNEDREIWSSSLTCIYEKLGRQVTDSLVLSYLFLQAKNTKMPQMANAIVQVDSQLWNGQHYVEVKQCFVDHGILEWSVSIPDRSIPEDLLRIRNSLNWSTGSGDLEVVIISPDVQEIELYDLTGKLILNIPVNGKSSYTISPSGLNAGMYILKATTSHTEVVTRIMRY